MASEKSVTTDVEQQIPLAEIHVDSKWNVRSGDWASDNSESPNDSNFKDLMASIAKDGQDEAVTVRPRKGNVGPQKYDLVCGFRRFAAIQAITTGDKAPTIRAVVKNLSDAQARALNLRENTARQNLSGADLAFGVHDLVQRYKIEGRKATSVDVAAELGKNQAYIGRLMEIMARLSKPLAQKWRESKVELPYLKVHAISKLDADRQAEQWEIDFGEKKKEDKIKGPGAWIETAMATARQFGATIGFLEAAGLIDAKGLDFEGDMDSWFRKWDPEKKEFNVSLNKKAEVKDRGKIAKEADRAYKAAAKFYATADVGGEDEDAAE